MGDNVVVIRAPLEAGELRELLRRTDKANPKAEDVRALRKCLEETPELWRVVGDLARIAEQSLIQTIAGKSVVIYESLDAGRERMRADLGYAAAPPLEKLLIEHVVLCWLRLQKAEEYYTVVTSQSITLTLGDFWERRLSATQRRYLRACETLVRIRRLALPAVQVNIGERQVNIAAGDGSCGRAG